jgi:hypothetical protein
MMKSAGRSESMMGDDCSSWSEVVEKEERIVDDEQMEEIGFVRREPGDEPWKET